MGWFLATSTDSGLIVGIVVAVVGFILSAIAALVAIVFRQIQKDIEALARQLKESVETLDRRIGTNGRHLDSVMTELWRVWMRVTAIEDFLEGNFVADPNFHPIRNFPGEKHEQL